MIYLRNKVLICDKTLNIVDCWFSSCLLHYEIHISSDILYMHKVCGFLTAIHYNVRFNMYIQTFRQQILVNMHMPYSYSRWQTWGAESHPQGRQQEKHVRARNLLVSGKLQRGGIWKWTRNIKASWWFKISCSEIMRNDRHHSLLAWVGLGWRAIPLKTSTNLRI